MQNIFLPPDQFTGDTARIDGADHQHLARALRARVGQRVLLLNNRGAAFLAELIEIGKNTTTARLLEPKTLDSEPPLYITVAQALGKGDKFEQVIQHGTEAGASAFLPIRAERCVADIPPNKTDERLARWRQIAKSAAEQSGRARIPEVGPPTDVAGLLQFAAQAETRVLLLHPDPDALPLRAALENPGTPFTRLVLAIGPEGGWSSQEVSRARAANVAPVSLGPRILRTETAALIAISQALYAMEGNAT